MSALCCLVGCHRDIDQCRISYMAAAGERCNVAASLPLSFQSLGAETPGRKSFGQR